jgi:two-component system NtrC family response regulator/two-component system response regulator PilR (NtrC family)
MSTPGKSAGVPEAEVDRPSTILIVDDKKNILTVLEAFLTQEGYRVLTAQGGREGYRRAVQETPDLVLCDIRMDDMDGLQLAAMLRSQGLELRFVFITAFATVQGAVHAMKGGAYDYLTKPLDYARLRTVLQQALSKPTELDSKDHRIIGSSPAMQSVFRKISAVSASNVTVLIIGESGTGKELITRSIHAQSRRSGERFVPVHCAAFSPTLLESELFGYEKGAFTGAESRKHGFFELADRGTLFLDEISEVSPDTQVKLLRVLQEREFTRVGGTEYLKVDVRLIAATNRDLGALVEDGSFREDLYYRLNVVPIHVPPLRERRSDIPELVSSILEMTCAREELPIPEVDGETFAALDRYHWPGNVRELQNIIERVVVLHRPERITVDMVADELAGSMEQPLVRSGAEERDAILDALRRAHGNKSDAARLLGLSRRTLYYKLEKYHLTGKEL